MTSPAPFANTHQNQPTSLTTSTRGSRSQQNFKTMTDEILERLEWEHGGDMIEYEFWRDPVTNKLYNVPIEIVRDFDNAEEVEEITKY